MTRALTNRVNLRGVPKELSGIPVSRETLERIKLKIDRGMPLRPLERPLSDLLAHAYMVGFLDAVKSSGVMAEPTPAETDPSGAQGTELSLQAPDHPLPPSETNPHG